MVLAVAVDTARKNQIRREAPGRGGGTTQIPIFGSRDNPNLPLASLNQLDPGLYSSTHFHIVDQFQVIVDGKGKLGRHALAPYGVHFSRAYTPYGPLVSDAGDGLKFFVMRAHPDTGSQRDLAHLKQIPNREPWQITRAVNFPVQSATADMTLEPIPGIQDERGLAAYALSMKPHAKAIAPDPSHGDGQYVIVVKGSLFHGGGEYRALSMLFVYPNEGPFKLHAGAQGLEALALNFPTPQV